MCVYRGETPSTSLSQWWGLEGELQLRRRERVPVDIPEHHSLLADRGATGRALGGSAAGACLGSLIAASWNQLVEWLKRLETLRKCVGSGPERDVTP